MPVPWIRGCAVFAALCALGCIQVTRTSDRPDNFEDADRHCRTLAEEYGRPAAAYARCMRAHGFERVYPDHY